MQKNQPPRTMNLFKLVVMLAGIVSLPAKAQLVPSWDDSLKVLMTYSRLTSLINDRMVEQHLPNLVNLEEVDDMGYPYKLGTTGARRLLWAVAVREAVGDPALKKGDQYGLLQIRPIMLEDYFRLNSKAQRFDISELQKEKNILLSMKILNTYIGCKGYHLSSKERVLRAWNGGPDGWREIGTKGEDPEHHELELQRTWDYYQEVLMYEKLCTFFEENGYAHIMWDWRKGMSDDPFSSTPTTPTISVPPKF